MSEKIEPYSGRPTQCPKCLGNSYVVGYVSCNTIRDEHGHFSITLYGGDVEFLIVKCRACGYERLMQTADSVDN